MTTATHRLLPGRRCRAPRGLLAGGLGRPRRHTAPRKVLAILAAFVVVLGGARPAAADNPLDSLLPGDALTDVLTRFVASLIAGHLLPVINILANLVLATPNLTGNREIVGLTGTMRLIGELLLGLLVVVGAVIVASRETLQTRTRLAELAPRIVTAAVACYLSLPVCQIAISTANTLLASVVGLGTVDRKQATDAINEYLHAAVDTWGVIIQVPLVLAVVLVVAVLATVVGRLVLTTILVIVAPLALVCHATPQTEGLARLWWRAFAGCLLIQIGQALCFVIAMRLFLTPHPLNIFLIPTTSGALVDLLALLGALWVMLRIPAWVRRGVFGGQGRGLVGSVVRTLVTLKTLRILGNRNTGAGRAGASHAHLHAHQHSHLHAHNHFGNRRPPSPPDPPPNLATGPNPAVGRGLPAAPGTRPNPLTGHHIPPDLLGGPGNAQGRVAMPQRGPSGRWWWSLQHGTTHRVWAVSAIPRDVRDGMAAGPGRVWMPDRNPSGRTWSAQPGSTRTLVATPQGWMHPQVPLSRRGGSAPPSRPAWKPVPPPAAGSGGSGSDE